MKSLSEYNYPEINWIESIDELIADPSLDLLRKLNELVGGVWPCGYISNFCETIPEGERLGGMGVPKDPDQFNNCLEFSIHIEGAYLAADTTERVDRLRKAKRVYLKIQRRESYLDTRFPAGIKTDPYIYELSKHKR